MRVNWDTKVTSKPVLYFRNLSVGQSFRNASNLGKGAIYVKVENDTDGSFWMMEWASGLLFKPTESPVEEVNVVVSIDAPKPKIY